MPVPPDRWAAARAVACEGTLPHAAAQPLVSFALLTELILEIVSEGRR